MGPKLYMTFASPPVRAVLMTAEIIGLELERVEVDLPKGEHKTPELLKLNPQHTVPILEDNSFVLWDSHAIMTYLVPKYAKNDSLYPKELKQRAVVDQRLHFDNGVLWPRLTALVAPLRTGQQKTFNQTDVDSVLEAYAFLEEFLQRHLWVAGDSLTIADISLVASLSAFNFEIGVPVDAKTFPKITEWLKRCESLPAYEINRKGLPLNAAFLNILKSQ